MGSTRYLMTCGHVANATDEAGNPACAICTCFEVKREVDTASNPAAGLEGRVCECPDCGARKPSAWNLPFFQYRPNRECDGFYDGCCGWD